MKRANFLLTGIVVFMLVSTNTLAQKDLQNANQLFSKLAYADAIPKYEKFIANDSSALEAKVKLADCYRMTGNYVEAEKWYAKVAVNEKATDLDRFHYGQMLMNNGRYAEAKKWLKVSQQERPHDERSENFLSAIDKIEMLFADSVNYKVSNLATNNNGNDFSPVYYKEGIVYTASKTSVPHAKTHSWTGESFTKLYRTENGMTTPFAKEIQVKFNNGPASFGSENEIYSTTNILKVAKSKHDIYKLNIVYSKFNGKNWSKPTNFKYNSPQYNIAHPSATADGKRLYFSSDMPGGEGGMDLYYSDLTSEGWSAPVNLGKDVNTPGNEVFPMIHLEGALYFASNGHEGIGGLDVHVTSFDSVWQKPIALPYPVNSRYDDFGFIINNEKNSGYFASNRPGGKGGDDIYNFEFTPSLLDGIVLNEDTKEVLPNTRITIVESATGKALTVVSDNMGKFKTQISSCRSYDFKAVNEDYATEQVLQLKTSCTSTQAGKLEILFKNPILKFETIDKYSGQLLAGSFIEIVDSESKKLLASGKASDLAFKAVPCKEYNVVAKKEPLPDVKTYFKTSCVAHDEVVKIYMGLPPVDPLFIGGVVSDKDSKQTLDSVAVVIYNINNQPVATVTSSVDGNFGITGFQNIDRLVFFRNGYFSVTKSVKNEANKKNILVEMPKLKLDAIIQLEGIYYDVGKFTIRPDAARVLDNVVKVMKENSSLFIELGAHTDARGNDNSNMVLSDNRAKAAAQYIIDNGIDANRISGKGYGESILKNACGNGIKCQEKQHQENRRTEVKVTAY
jgi:outer membrane protein OmpA-like peptidoglycan-associated protein/tetratricopeptide (TPR) repeat protein